MISRVVLPCSVIGFAVFGAWIGYMILDRKPPYDYQGEPASYMRPNPVQDGGIITAKWKLKPHDRECPVTVQRVFTNEDTLEVVSSQDTTHLLRFLRHDDDHLPRSFSLPPGLPVHSGYQAQVCFYCNMLQYLFPVCIVTPKLKFSVLPATRFEP